MKKDRKKDEEAPYAIRDDCRKSNRRIIKVIIDAINKNTLGIRDMIQGMNDSR